MGWEGFSGKTTDEGGEMATAMIPSLVPRGLLLLLAMASLSLNGANAQSQGAAATAERGADGVDGYITMKMTRQHIPGLTLAVIRDGKIVKLKGYGLASLELKVPAAVETVYPINSVTKQFAAAGVMILVEEGKVGLDDKISTHLDGTPEAWKDINVRHLLTHTSGLKDFIDEPTASLRLDMTDEEIFKAAAPRPLNFSPGEKFSYCNTGYHLLAMMIRKVTGKSYGEFLQRRIFDPLGMEDTRIISHSEIIPNRASGYLWNGAELQNGEYVAASLLGAANGGLRSTVLDLAKWDAALDEAKLIKTSSLEQMWTSAKLNDGRPAHYGFGWIPGSVRGHRYASHTGGHWTGYSCVVTRFLDDHLTVVLLTNQSGRAKPAGIAEGVARY
ncbi:serine hydrolase domain-containing protein [Singulisphaera rosea]